MTLVQMSVSGGALILLIAVVRVLAAGSLPRRTFPVLWAMALIRLLVPVRSPWARGPFHAPGGTPDISALPGAAGTATARAALGAAPPMLRLVWLAGAIAIAGVFLASYLRCRREFKASLPAGNEFTDAWLGGLPSWRRIEIRKLPGLGTPLTYGILRPVILVPEGFCREGTRQAEFILCHEYTHIRRFDAAAKLLAAAAVCVHWFNPAVWLMFTLYGRDMELACDESVLRRFGEGSRAEYARTLIQWEERRAGYRINSFFAKNAVEERINAIMKTKKTTVLTAGLAALIVAGTAAAFAVLGPADEEKSNYPVNENGQTYGSVRFIEEGEGAPGLEAPDLIAAIGIGGVEGYVYKDDVFDEPASSPEEAAAQMKEREEKISEMSQYVVVKQAEGEPIVEVYLEYVPLYAQDGVTVIGQFGKGSPVASSEYTHDEIEALTEEMLRQEELLRQEEELYKAEK